MNIQGFIDPELAFVGNRSSPNPTPRVSSARVLLLEGSDPTNSLGRY